MKQIRTSSIIHGFALLHFAAAALCRLCNVEDELVLTTLTIILSVILCFRYRQSMEFSAIVIIIANIFGFLLGNGTAYIVKLITSHPILYPAIATFLTTEIMGWALVGFMNHYIGRGADDRSAGNVEKTWLVIAIALILLIRVIIRLFKSTLFSGGSMTEALVDFSGNSIALLFMVCITIFFISFRKNHPQASPHILKSIGDAVLFFILTSSLSALIVGYSFPFHLDKGLTARHYMELLLVALICEALIYSIIYMIEYAITARRKAENEKSRADLAKFQYLNLKQQVNPHFLFNSLNILDALVLDGKDQEASTYIHKLAGLYRYMLKNEEEATVSLRDEMTYVDMYSDLLKVRFQKGFVLDSAVREEDMARYVIPCSIQLLIENATKHNAVSPERPLYVRITSDGESVTVTNNLIPRVTKSQSSGLGLNYIRKQYMERSGKGIEIEKTEGAYTVKLPLL